MKRVLLICVAMFLILNCSKQEKTYEIIKSSDRTVFLNSNKEAEPDLRIDLKLKKEVFSKETPDFLNGFNYFVEAINDKYGNYYITGTNENGLILKYDNNLNFMKSFSRKGQGPGEAEFYNKVIILDDKIHAFSFNNQIVNIFGYDGEFISCKRLDHILTNLEMISEDRILATKWHHISLIDNKSELTIENVLLDNNFKEIKSLSKLHEILDTKINPESIYYPFISVTHEEIYISWINDKEYNIEVYNSYTGTKKYDIKKNYSVDYYSDIEMDRMSLLNGIDMKKEFGKIKKRAINEIFVDKDSRLWVLATKKRTKENQSYLYADIFKDGVYLKTLNFPEIVYHDGTSSKYYYKIRFVGDLLFYFNYDEYDEEKGAVIRVYEY